MFLPAIFIKCPHFICCKKEFWDIIDNQFSQGIGTEEGHIMKHEVEKNTEQYINEKETSSKKIYQIIKNYA